MIVVSDTTPLISLLKLDLLDILQKMYSEVALPEAVYDELEQMPRSKRRRRPSAIARFCARRLCATALPCGFWRRKCCWTSGRNRSGPGEKQRQKCGTAVVHAAAEGGGPVRVYVEQVMKHN